MIDHIPVVGHIIAVDRYNESGKWIGEFNNSGKVKAATFHFKKQIFSIKKSRSMNRLF